MKGFFTARGINGAINIGIGACSFLILTTLVITIFLVSDSFYITLNVVQCLICAMLGFGIYKKSRVCSWLALILYVLIQFANIVASGYTRFNLLWIYFIFSFCYTIMGIQLYHKIKREGPDSPQHLMRNTIYLFVSVLIIFFSSFMLSTYLHGRITERAWGKYVQSVEVDKQNIKLPVKIDDDVYLRDVYFEDKTLVFEYDVKHLKDLKIPEWYDKTKRDFSRFCYGPVVRFPEMNVLYRLTQGYEKREFKFNDQDCRYITGLVR